MDFGLNSLQYGVPYLGSHCNTGPYINFSHFGNSNLGKLPCGLWRPPFPYLVTADLAALGFHVSRSVLGNNLTGVGFGK